MLRSNKKPHDDDSEDYDDDFNDNDVDVTMMTKIIIAKKVKMGFHSPIAN